MSLPPNSPFENWKEARRFAGPLPFSFTFQPHNNSVLIIEGVRSNWIPRPISVMDFSFPWIDSLGLQDAVLANAFILEQVPYFWKKANWKMQAVRKPFQGVWQP